MPASFPEEEPTAGQMHLFCCEENPQGLPGTGDHEAGLENITP